MIPSRLVLLCESIPSPDTFGFDILYEEDTPVGLDFVRLGIVEPRTGKEATIVLIARSTSDQYINAVTLSGGH